MSSAIITLNNNTINLFDMSVWSKIDRTTKSPVETWAFETDYRPEPTESFAWRRTNGLSKKHYRVASSLPLQIG